MASLYNLKKYEKAKLNLQKVELTQSYGVQAKYYIGFMAYETDDYSQASVYFDQLENNEAYKDNLSYYKARISFHLVHDFISTSYDVVIRNI